MMPSPWRDVTIGFVLPEIAFGAAVSIDGLLEEPELHFAPGPAGSRLTLIPRVTTFARLLLEWETLPELGTFTASSLPGTAALSFDAAELARIGQWMRDVATHLHAYRRRIVEASERAIRDASAGLDRSMPEEPTTHDSNVRGVHVVSARIGTRVAGPTGPEGLGVVDLLPDPAGDGVFVERATRRILGRRSTLRRADGGVEVDYRVDDDAPQNVGRTELDGWYDQHIAREVLFDDVRQTYVHLIAGLDAPLSVSYSAR